MPDIIIKGTAIKDVKKNKKLFRKLKLLHREIFSQEKLIMPEENGIIYTISWKIPEGKRKIIGMCQVIHKNPEFYCDDFIADEKSLYLMDFGIIPKYRRKNFGTLFLDEIKNNKITKRYNFINIHVQDGEKLEDGKFKNMNTNSIKVFYIKNGFELMNDKWLHPDETRRYARMLHQI